MRYGVVCSRGLTDKVLIIGELTHYVNADLGPEHIVLLGGGSPGPDTWVREWAADCEYPHIMLKPYFMVDNQAVRTPRHFFMRNKQLVDNSDVVIAFWDGASRGTQWTINYAQKKGKTVHVIHSV